MSDVRYYPPVSRRWLDRAYEAGGHPAALLGLLIWERYKLRWPVGGKLPSHAKLTFRRAHEAFGLHRRAFRSALTALEDAGLVHLKSRAAGGAHEVRVIPFPGEERWTEHALRWKA